MTDLEKTKFIKAAERAAQIVESWPEWKKTGFKIKFHERRES